MLQLHTVYVTKHHTLGESKSPNLMIRYHRLGGSVFPCLIEASRSYGWRLLCVKCAV